GRPLAAAAGEEIRRTRFLRLVLVLAPAVEDFLDEELGDLRRTNAVACVVVEIGRDGERIAVAAQGEPHAERVVRPRVRGLDEALLAPGGAVAGEDISRAHPDVRASPGRRVVRAPRRIDARRQAGFIAGADRDRVPVLAHGEGKAEPVARLAFRSFDERLLAPGAVLAREHEQRAGLAELVVVRRIDATARAALVERRR